MGLDLIFDFGEAPKFDEYDLLPPGQYDAIIDTSKAKKVETAKSEKKTQYINLVFQIVGPVEHKGKKFRQALFLGGGGAGFAERLFKALKMYDPAKGTKFRIPDLDRIHGTKCKIRVKQRPMSEGSDILVNDVTSIATL